MKKNILILLFMPIILYAQIADIYFSQIKETYATLNWHTDIPTTGKVFFGRIKNQLYNQSISLGYSTNHTVILKNLKKGTRYYYYIESSTKKGQINKTKLLQFTTAGIPATRLLEETILTNGKTYFMLRWKANVPVKVSLVYIKYGETKKKETPFSDYISKGIIKITNLRPRTLYYYALQYQDKRGKIYKSTIKTIQTLEDNIALQKPVIGTFTNNIYNDKYFVISQHPIERVTDGKLEYFSGMAISGNIKLSDQFVVINLKQIIDIAQINIYWRALSYSTDYTIAISLNNKKWTIIRKNINARKGRKMRGSKGDPILYNEIKINKKAQYIKLIAKKNKFYNKHKEWNYVQLMEIKVYPINFIQGGDSY